MNHLQAAKVTRSFGPNMAPRWIVIVDADAAEIMCETKTRYVYSSRIGADRFAAVLQANLNAAWAS